MGLFDIFKKKQETIPFSEPVNSAVYTCRHVMTENSPILHIAHDMNGDWQFLCNHCGQKLDLNKVMIVALSDVYKKHNEIEILNHLKLGTQAFRQDENSEWLYQDIAIDEYQEWLDNIKNAIAQENTRRNGVLRSDFSGIKIYRDK